MAPLSAILLIFSYIVAAIAVPIVAPLSERSTGPFSEVQALSSDDGPSVAARGSRLISGATLPPVDKSIFKRIFPGLFGSFGGGGFGGGGGGGGGGHGFGLIPGGGGGGGCHGLGCFLEKPDKPGKNKDKDGEDGSASAQGPPVDSQNAPPGPQASTSPPNNVPAEADVSGSKGGGVAGGKKGSAKTKGGN